MKNNREATSIIKGYIYQFDATIKKIFQNKGNHIIQVEGIEDFDLKTDNLINYYQCKYLSSKKYSLSSIRKAIIPMISNFIKTKNNNAIRYTIYCYFQNSYPGSITLNLKDFKKILITKKKVSDSKGSKYFKEIDLQKKLKLSNKNIIDFLKIFNIEIAEEYDLHKQTIFNLICKKFRCTDIEAKKYYYPSALAYISEISTKSLKIDRQIKCGDFFKYLNDNKSIFNVWYLKEKKSDLYCKYIRKSFFLERNIEPYARFFVIEITNKPKISNIKHILLSIQNKWSSHKIRRKPNKERYAPYIFLRNISNDILIKIKKELKNEKYNFIDGYSFQGSTFDINEIKKSQTFENKISLRFINNEKDLNTCLKTINKTKVIYDFYNSKPMNLNHSYKIIKIYITEITQIKKII